MKLISAVFISLFSGIGAIAQTTIPNGGFETWGNPSPGLATEPTGWYSNKSGSTIAKLGDTTCFKDAATAHSGSYSVMIKTVDYFGTKINGVVTTAVVNAPSIDKSKGYIGTINRDDTSDKRRTAFTGRPDSLVGWYQYTQGTPGGGSEQGKIRAVLHTSHYFDPETPVSGNHADLSANKIGDALFITPMSNIGSWTRFSVPFNYVSASAPSYILLNITASNNQLTTVGGSTLLLDDLEVIYNTPTTRLNGNTTMAFTISAFPNPVEDELIVNIKGIENVAGRVQLMDMSGRVISNLFADTTFCKIGTSSLAKGVYLVRYTDSEHTQTIKIIKQ